MYCAKCGNQTAEGAKFCNSCGAVMSQSEASISQSAESTMQGKGNGQPAPKKSYKKLAIIISSIIGIVLICILIFNNLWAVSPKTYYGYLESRNKPIVLNNSYNKVIKAFDIKPFSKNIGITVSEVGGLSIGKDMLEDFEIQAQVDHSKGKSTVYASAKYLNNLLADAILYQDKEILGLGLPTLYNKNFSIKKDEISETIINLTGNETDIDLKTLSEIKDQLDKDTRLLDKAIEKYGKIAYKNIPSSSISVTSPDNAADIYTWQTGSAKTAIELKKSRMVDIKLTEKDLYDITDKLLKELRDDDELLNMLINYVPVGYALSPSYFISRNEISNEERADLLEELKTNLDRSREDLEYTFDAESEKIIATMTIISDTKNKIVSREVTLDNLVFAMMQYVNDDKEDVTEINVSEGRFGTGDQIGNLYIYNGEERKGIRYEQRYGMGAELTYKRSEKGMNSSGLEYGDYKASISNGNYGYAVKLSARKDDSKKKLDLYDVTVQQNNNNIVKCKMQVDELKNKSNLRFSKSSSVDLATADADELSEVFDEIGDEFQSMTKDLVRNLFRLDSGPSVMEAPVAN